ncbi:uncharacterized protein LOC136721633 [Amia ocellicauda]|uniref:uncharacterized protein LOC136721633 n=1 Tax=Amia ocellicauda TaxID=2972642 RepID=UPI003463BD10
MFEARFVNFKKLSFLTVLRNVVRDNERPSTSRSCFVLHSRTVTFQESERPSAPVSDSEVQKAKPAEKHKKRLFFGDRENVCETGSPGIRKRLHLEDSWDSHSVDELLRTITPSKWDQTSSPERSPRGSPTVVLETPQHLLRPQPSGGNSTTQIQPDALSVGTNTGNQQPQGSPSVRVDTPPNVGLVSTSSPHPRFLATETLNSTPRLARVSPQRPSWSPSVSIRSHPASFDRDLPERPSFEAVPGHHSPELLPEGRHELLRTLLLNQRLVLVGQNLVIESQNTLINTLTNELYRI